MGFKIYVVDEFPSNIPDIHEPPFQFDAWVHNVMNSGVAARFGFLVCSILLILALIG
jgi:hypothetical protein